MSTPDLAAVIALLDRLSPEDKLQLIEHVARDLQQKSQSTLRLSWKDARGLGKEIWGMVQSQVTLQATLAS